MIMYKQYKETKLDRFNIKLIKEGSIIKIKSFNDPYFELPSGYIFPYFLIVNTITNAKNEYVKDQNLINWDLHLLINEECYFLHEIKSEPEENLLEFPFTIYNKNKKWYIRN